MARHLLRATVCLAVGLVAGTGSGQQPPIHYFHSATLPPGTAGQGQLLRFPALRNYFQPVKLLVPEGVRISLEIDGQFESPHSGPVVAGMQVGSVYRMKITGIPFYEGFEVYPTIELLNRLYPPAGQETQFPVPVELTQSELELALSGQFVTRVIYLEDPETALAYADEADRQRYFEAPPGEDPLQVADRLGRPMAILRMGSRVPDSSVAWDDGHGSPPLLRYSARVESRPAVAPISAIERQLHNIPRVPQPASPGNPLR